MPGNPQKVASLPGAKILPPRLHVVTIQGNHHMAVTIAIGNGLLDIHPGIAGIFGGDHTEYIGRHHAQGGTADDLVTERAATVAQHQLSLVRMDQIKIARLLVTL